MATGRTLNRWAKIYIGGIDITPSSKSIGPLVTSFNYDDLTTITDSVKGGLPMSPNITPNVLNGIINAGAGTYMPDGFNNYVGLSKVSSIALGIRAIPAIGDPCFNGHFNVLDLAMEASLDSMALNMQFGNWDAANLPNYTKPWGNVVHAHGAETGANSANTNVDNGAATSLGGYLAYHVFASSSGAHTYTISIDDSANGTDWLALSGATTGEISGTGIGGIVQLGTTATVRRYLRWQLALGTATSVTFFLAFVRG